MDGLDRSAKALLVTECQALGMIGVIRSLGRAGYQVHAVSSHSDALGFRSRFATAKACHPRYDAAEFIGWLDAYLAKHKISAIVPSEDFLHGIGAEYGRFSPLLPDAVPRDVWDRCMSKTATQQHLLAHDPACAHLPPGGIVGVADPVPSLETIARHRAPYYVKADAGQAIGGASAAVVRCHGAQPLRDEIARLKPHYRAVLWQGYAPGKKVGVSLWRHNNAFLAESMTLGVHMAPHTGGMMSLRKTFWHEAILRDAKDKLTQLGWEGVAMMEYKWDPEMDEFWFIEINARYWGYLHLDLLAGKDFPRLQFDAFFGGTQTDLGPASRHVTCRNTVPGEVGYLASVLRDHAVSGWHKIRESAAFVGLFLNPMVRADLLFPGDRRLYWLAWKRFILDLARR